jgi:hypothetical protein
MLDGWHVIVVTPGYAPAEMFARGCELMADKWTPGLVDEKWLLLNKYPLPSVETNEAALIEAAARFGYNTFDSGADLGLAGSLEHFFKTHRQPQNTLLISVDPDSTTDDAGFDLALCQVVTAGRRVPACALGIPQVEGMPVTMIAGHRVFVHPSMMMTNIGCVDLGWYGAEFKANGKLWGGNESKLYERLKATGTRLGYLLDYTNAPGLRRSHDIRYAIWKWEHFYGRFSGSFAEYLASPKCTDDLIGLCGKQRMVLDIADDLVASVENGTDLTGAAGRLRTELDGLGDYGG